MRSLSKWLPPIAISGVTVVYLYRTIDFSNIGQQLTPRTAAISRAPSPSKSATVGRPIPGAKVVGPRRVSPVCPDRRWSWSPCGIPTSIR